MILLKRKFIYNVIFGKINFKLLFDGILVGIFSGALSVLYRYIIFNLEKIRNIIFQSDKVILVIAGFTLMGLIVNYLLKYSPLSGGSGIPQIRAEILGKISMKENRIIPSKFIGGSMAALAGLSLGREGPSIQIGGAGAKLLAKILKRDSAHEKYMISAGASAGLAAAFNAPLAATLFSLEELHKSFSEFILIPCIISSVIANAISFSLMGQETAFSFKVIKNFPVDLIWIVMIIGIFSGLIGVIFNKGLVGFQKLYRKVQVPAYVKLIFIFILAVFIGYNFHTIVGGGHHLVEEMARENYGIKILVILLFAKMLYTFISYGSGVQGGIFLPVLVLGALVGLIFFNISSIFINIDDLYVNFMILGMAGVLTAVVRAPIMSIVLVMEMTGSFSQLLNLTMVSIVAYFVADMCNEEPIYDSLFKGIMERFKNKTSSQSNQYNLNEYIIMDNMDCINLSLRDAQWPAPMNIVSITRDGIEFVPTAEDKLLIGDKILVITNSESTFEVDKYFL